MSTLITSSPPRRGTRRRASCPNLGIFNFSSILHPPSSDLAHKRRGSMAVPVKSTRKGNTLVIQWVLDTRKLWPKAARTMQLAEHAKRALALLSIKEREDVLKFVHVRDAKMALGSKLLKRYLIARYANCPWDSANMTRNKDTKPVYIAPDGTEPLIFNVTHQAGLVVLAAAYHPPPGTAIGVDVVCPTERRDRDHQLIHAEGWKTFVGIHDEVLCPAEVTSLNRLPFKDLDHKLRYFYTLWCLREAYVKMTGEALLASWLKKLEMRYFTPPEDAPTDQTEIWFHGRRLEDVDLDFVNVLDGFMICTATRRDKKGERLDIGEYELIDIEEAISFGEKSRSPSRPVMHKALTTPVRTQQALKV